MNNSTIAKWFKPNFDVTIAENKVANKAVKDVTAKKLSVKKILQPPPQTVPGVNLSNVIAPKTVADLAVHNKKIEEVENWLIDNVISSNKVSILLLTGPTGSGKTSSINVLCKSLSIEIVEWINVPDLIELDEFRGPGQAARFTDFLTQSSRYPSLFDSTALNKKIILVEDFPNFLVRSPSDFEGILENYVAKGKSSIVFICTDIKDRSINFSHQLFPQATQQKFDIKTISFNPVSVTLLKKAIKRATTIAEEKRIQPFQKPSQDSIDIIVNTCMGDIRSAFNYLNFATLKGSKALPSSIQKSNPTSGKRKRKDKDTAKLTSMRCDESLGLLHAIGRVLYAKRIDCQPHWKFEHQPESIINQFMSQPSTFVAFLHENYLRYFGSFTDMVDASDLLSSAELFVSDWREKDTVMQYGMWIAVMGLMMTNNNVVSKWNPVRGPKQFKYRNKEKSAAETEQAIDKTYIDLILKSSIEN